MYSNPSLWEADEAVRGITMISADVGIGWCYLVLLIGETLMKHNRKKIAATVMLLLFGASAGSWQSAGAQTGTAESAILGKVLATIDAGTYTYLQLGASKGTVWVALPRMKLKKGQEVAVQNGMTMKNFKSKTLKLTFDAIIFSGGIAGQHKDTKTAAESNNTSASLVDVKVDKAEGDNAYTISELFAKRTDLSNKKVRVHAKVVKVSMMIMGKNWMHLQDGTGNTAKENNDLVVTTQSVPKKGAVITVEGILRTDKDFGAGYRYDAIIENAEFK